MDRPRIRSDIEVFPARYRDRSGIVIKDSLGLIREPVFLPQDMVAFLRFLDGTRSSSDIQLELMRQQGGVYVSGEEIGRIIAELDRGFLLDSDRYRERKSKLIRDYAALEVRESALAGKAYPDEQDGLASYLRSIIEDADMNGAPPDRPITGLVAPHIDLEVGRRVYGRGYSALKSSRPKRVVLLGTGHSLDSYVSLTDKDFVTPLGRVPTAGEAVNELRKAASRPEAKGLLAPDDFAHRTEHSLEFQIIFLQHLLGRSFDLVPLLCGAFHEVLGRTDHPAEIPGLSDFLAALRQIVGDGAPDVLVVAGIDFSHIGPKFGHDRTASAMRPEAETHDRALIEALCRSDAASFWRILQQVDNRYNVCGLSPLAVLLEILPGREGRLLDYEMWMEEPTQSAVSFAALAYD